MKYDDNTQRYVPLMWCDCRLRDKNNYLTKISYRSKQCVANGKLFYCLPIAKGDLFTAQYR